MADGAAGSRCRAVGAVRRRRSGLDAGRARRHETQLGDVLELADIARHLQEGVETGPLTRSERVAELLEVASQIARRIAVALARLVREHLGLRAGQTHR